MLIAVTSPSFSKNKLLRSEILQHFSETRFNDSGERLVGERLVNFVSDAEGVIVGLEKIDREMINRLQHLKIISKYGVGLDNIDIEYCKRKNIHIGWTPGVNKTSVAEMTVAFMIALSRNIYLTSNQLKNSIWNKDGGFDLSGKTVGIIGIGNVGKEVVRYLKPFHCIVLVNDIVDQTDYYNENNLKEESKEELYRQSDIVTLHVPLTVETDGLINSSVLKMMKRSSYLINTSRGRVVEQDDLKWALKNGIIAGAAIDVYNEEPPEDADFLSLPNLICTPHIGGNSQEAVLSMGRSAIQHLRDYFKI
jgi:phosphoglycerate dehydrogenase-like enzyme